MSSYLFTVSNEFKTCKIAQHLSYYHEIMISQSR